MLRDSDVELFEDDPMEFIRRDLEGSDNESRQRAACDLTRGLLVQFEKPVTEIFSSHVQKYLESYSGNVKNWKSKDTALFLITSLSAKAVTYQVGATCTNEFIQVKSVFYQHILPDLKAALDSLHPIIKIDAIKFLEIFRSQVSTI